MSKSFFSDKHFQRWLFLFAGGAFGLSLLKNLFLEQHPGILFYMLELLSFVFFLLAFYLSDRNHQVLHGRLNETHLQKEREVLQLKEKIDELKSTVDRYEAIQNEATRFASYQDKIVKKLLDSKKVRGDKHHFLFLLSELFHGMAAVLYKKEELKDLFVVEESYGLPEDYSPVPFHAGEGLHGQSVVDGKAIQIEELPEDYVEVNSGLGKSGQYFLYMLPVIKENNCYALIEIMTFRETEVQRLWPGIMEQLVDHGIL
ncbi:GAF domain-containing protein [Marinilabilia rubra]|uniref:GAF domain-containing protein n=1 Tax=Marinilabilia rubra TaxID=2162893 RepID=A0A2U2B8N1_9BACT|nr:GAF domain-containing protein [Marinilabilia rubra]PWD99402.1 GAF domain-containing protein [Marinilabilia rubra]